MTVNIDKAAASGADKMDGLTPILVSDDGYGGRDRLFSVEKIKLSDKDDVVRIGADSGDLLKPLQEIDGGGGRNTLDLRPNSSGITFENNKIKGYDTQFKNFNVLSLGDGSNIIGSSVAGLTINLGTGNNTVKATGPGTIVKSGGGANKVEASHNGQLLFQNAGTADHITYYGSTLTGGVHWGGSESVYAYGIHGERYGRNQQGDLVILDASGNETFIPRFNFSTDGTSRTAGLYVIDVHYEIRSGNIWTTGFQAAAIMLQSLKKIGAALHGWQLHGTDPLVLDLDGNGIPLTGRDSSGVVFDINNNQFAAPVGWVDANDGILVRDLNGNGKIDNDSEMFGGPQAGGFAQLATLDGNHDGKVDASDNGLADFNGDGVVDVSDTLDSLKIWVDANQDGVTDAGELHALSDYDIVSIAVGSTPSTITDSGNDIIATGTFKRADGSTGMVGEVQLDTDNHNTRWTGDSSVSADAASRPDLKGFGTVTDLHVAMTLDPGLIGVVDAAMPGLNSLSLASLRAAVRPVLGAWAAATPIPAGTPGTEPTQDFDFVGATTEKGAIVYDYLIEKQDDLGTYYAYASGQPVYDANLLVIDRPTKEQVLASTPQQGSWDKLSAGDIAFLERYTGNLIGLSVPVNPTAAFIADVAGAVTSAWNEINKLAVRLAAQGPLSPFFAGIAYDASSDFFRPTTAYQLQPMLQQVFAATPTVPADAEAYLKQWNNIIGMMLPDFHRDDQGRQVTDPFLFESIVAAYENVPVAIPIKDVAASLFDMPQSEIFMGPGTTTGGDTSNDILYINGPNETALGQGGQDAYVVGYNFGHATIHDEWLGLGDSQEDSIWFAHLNVSDLTFTREGIDLVISQNGTSDQIRVVDEFAGRRPGLVTAFQDFDESVEIVKFADGTTWDKFDIAKAVGLNLRPAADGSLIGTGDLDFLYAGYGATTMSGGNLADQYFYSAGDGNVTIDDSESWIWGENRDYVHFGAGITESDVTLQRNGGSNDLQFLINATGEVVTIKNQFEVDYGLLNTMTDRIEVFTFADGGYLGWEDIIRNFDATAGTDGNDTIYGFSYADTLAGGLGDDYLAGGFDADTYVYTRGDGNDTIFEYTDVQSGGGSNDTLVLHNIAVGDVSLVRNGIDATLVFAESAPGAGDGGSVLLQTELDDWFAQGVENIVFDDGTVWTPSDLRVMLLAQAVTDGNDVINGFNTNDVIRGGKGDDTLSGGAGDDTYVYARGDGNDTIIEGTAGNFSTIDTLTLHGVDPAAASLVRNGNDLTLIIAESAPGAGDGSSILLKAELDDFFSQGVENIAFDDGTLWTQADLRVKLLAQASTSGNDTINGFNTNDVIRGGAGNDTMTGGPGDDTYNYARGDGNDVIIEAAAGNFSTFDTLNLEGINPADVSLVRSGNDLTLVIAESAPGAGNGGSILLKAELDDETGVERVRFANGTVWTQTDLRINSLALAFTDGDDIINGFNTNDVLRGGRGNDTLSGGPGDDTYYYAQGDGNDVIIENAAGNFSTVDTLNLLDINPAGVSLVRNGNDLTVVIAETAPGAGNGGSILLKSELDDFFSTGVERIVFADGTIWTQADLRVKTLAQASTRGNDTITGFNTNDILTGGPGNDTLSGVAGDDTYIYARGDGNDTIIEGTAGNFTTFDTLRLQNIDPASVSFVRNLNDLTLVVAETAPGAGNGGSILLKDELDDWFSQGVERVAFDNGTVWSQADLRAMLLTQAINAGSGDILGFNVADTLVAGLGDRFLNGRGGADTYVYSSAGGNDVIADPGNFVSRLQFSDIVSTDVSLSRRVANNGADLVIINNLTGKTVTVQREFSGGAMLSVQFSDGVSWSQAQILDILAANGGGYMFGRGDGQVTFAQSVTSLRMAAGISASDVILQSSGTDLIVKLRGSTDSITVQGALTINAWGVSSSLAQLKFSDGTTLDLGKPDAGHGLPLTFTWLGTGNNYFLTGSNYGSNLFDITAGSGTVNFGNSTQGGDGKNTIKYIRGDATADVNLNGGTGTIAFGAGISAQDVYWQANGSGDLTFRFRGDATDSIIVHNDLANQAGTVTSGLRQLQFSDGSSVNLFQPLTFTWLGSNNNYFLTGSNYGANVFEITAGSGTVIFGNSSSGGNGTNIVKYNRGTGRLDVTLNGGTGTLQMGSGLTAGDVSFQSNSSGDLIVNINGDATDTVIIHNDYATVNGTVTSGIGQIQFGDGSSVSALSFDFIAPTVGSVTASGAGIASGDGAVGLGGVVTLTVNFSENVLVNTTGGTPTLSLNDGGVATYTGGTGTSALTFSYTVGAGQNTSDLTVTGLNLNGGTIADAAANAAVLSGATTNPAGTLLVDTSAPTVSSVTTSPASGTVITGAVVTLTVNFNENVTVNTSGGTPTLTLSDGGSATYTGGSGTSALTFSHTVAAGQSTADLTVTALNLNGGTIKDVASNAAVVTGAVTNPAGVLVVDGVAPTVSSIAASGMGITAGSGVLNAGKVVTLTANFTENVTVNTTGGTPTLTLNDGGTATYTGGSGTTALTFTYTVAAGQNTPDLAVTALNFNGATIKDAAGNTAVVTGAATNPAGTLQIDTTASTVSSVTTSGTGISSGSGTVGVGTVVTLTANFSENVVVTTTGGTPTLTLNDGGTATYTGGSGTGALTFNYTVAAGQNTSDLTVTALNLNGGTIKDVAGNTAVVTGAAGNPAGILVVDTTAPTVSSVTTSPGSGNVILGQVVTLTVNFSESVSVNTSGGAPNLALNDGGVATYTGGSGTGALTFSYTVTAGQSTSDLTVTALNLNGGTIKDAGGNAAVLTGAVTNPAGILLIDGNAPTATSIAATGTGITSGSGILNAGKVVTLKATLNEAATVTTTGGTPSLALNDGGVATYTSGSGTTALTFTYTVAAGQNTPVLTVTGLNLNGGTVKDAAGNTAVITGNPAGTLQIDTTSPSVNSVATSGTGITAGTGVLNAGKVVTLTANFSENVTVVTTGGKPTLTLNDGGSATYASGSGTAALAFTYTVAAGQNTPDLSVTALNLNGGTIKDAAGNAGVFTGAATNPAGTLQIDTTASTVSSVVTSGAGITAGTGSLNAGKVVTLILNFNESVVVAGGTPTLTLNDGGVATYTGGSGTSALAFNYTVAAGQNTADLTVTAFNLGTATIKDLAGNTAVVTGAVTNPAGTLKIDTTTPTVSSVATSGPGITSGNGTLGVGAVVTLTVNLSEAGLVTTTGGTPTLTLNDGGIGTYSGGSGTTALAFTYTVAAGQNTPDLTVTAANLNGGTITDTAGNAAVLTGAVTNPAGTLQISTPAGMMAPPSAPNSASLIESGPNIYTLSPTDSVTITPDYSSGISNEFDFTGNVTDQNLWFLQSGNNLQIDVIGTNDQTTLDGWFNSGNQASEVFTAGSLKLDNQISQLVQAMAAYSGSHAGFDPTASTLHQIPNDTALQNTVAAAWHA